VAPIRRNMTPMQRFKDWIEQIFKTLRSALFHLYSSTEIEKSILWTLIYLNCALGLSLVLKLVGGAISPFRYVGF
jgi:hypothetical protein